MTTVAETAGLRARQAAGVGRAIDLLEEHIDFDEQNRIVGGTNYAYQVQQAWLLVRATARSAAERLGRSFQQRVGTWVCDVLGVERAKDVADRTHRFLEEALETAQAFGCTREQALALCEHVFSKEPGDIVPEVGGALVTLAALCEAQGFDLEMAGERELARIGTPEAMARTRAKSLAQVPGSSLPGDAQPPTHTPGHVRRGDLLQRRGHPELRVEVLRVRPMSVDVFPVDGVVGETVARSALWSTFERCTQ